MTAPPHPPAMQRGLTPPPPPLQGCKAAKDSTLPEPPPPCKDAEALSTVMQMCKVLWGTPPPPPNKKVQSSLTPSLQHAKV